MFSPPEHCSIKELELRARGLCNGTLTSAEFHSVLTKADAILAYRVGREVVRIPPTALLVTLDGEYAYLDRTEWTLDLSRARSVARALSVEEGILLLTYEMDDEEFQKYPGGLNATFAQSLAKLDGWLIVLESEEAEAALEGLVGQFGSQDDQRPACPAKPRRRFADKAELERAMREWIASFPESEKPTTQQREQFFKDTGITRKRGRELLGKLAPDHWSRRGRPKKT